MGSAMPSTLAAQGADLRPDRRGSTRQTLLLLGLVGCLLCLAATLPAPAVAAVLHGGPSDPTEGYARYPAEARVVLVCRTFEHRAGALRTCLSANFLALVLRTGDPAHELPRIDRYVRITGGFVADNCHIIMHTVGRRYGTIKKVSLARLQGSLPLTNDPGCSAGFAHGLITSLGSQVIRLGPKGAAAACRRSATRYQRYSCVHGLGHAYMRTYMESLTVALPLCRALGPADATDCAQGAFHDYWLAAQRLDAARSPGGVLAPRALCGQQPDDFVRACWYRVFLERRPARPPATAAAVVALCHGLRSLQRLACITGASVISSSDPFRQLAICSHLRGAEAVSCVRGVVVPSLAGAPLSKQVRLITRCAGLDPSARQACREWFGKTLTVVTNGRFATDGCARLVDNEAEAACRRGARTYQGALETFS